MVTAQEAARDTAEAGVTRMIRTLAVVTPTLALLQALANARDYRQPAAAVVVWLAVIAAGTWLVPRLRAGGLTAGETAAATAIAVAAVAATRGAPRPPETQGSIDLAILGTVWLLLLVVASHPARVWVPLALLVFTVQGVLLIVEQGLGRLSLSQLGAAGYIMAAALIAFATLQPALDVHVGTAARQASLASRSAAERAAAAAVKQERDSRLAVLEQEALPLLRAIADGTLDPVAADVREQCGRHAAVLRRALTASAPGSGLTAGLERTLRAAAARGLLVTVQVIGDPGTPSPAVARAVLGAVDAVLSALPPAEAVLTVLAAGEDVELYLTFGAPLRAVPDLARLGLAVPAAARWRAALTGAETGEGFLEVSWRKGGAV
jgi:hypothetical protein